MRLLIIILFISCSSPTPLSTKKVNLAIFDKVINSNSYGGMTQDTINIISISPKGEFPISRIRRFHRRYDFKVKLTFNQDCYQLGDTCLSLRTYQGISNKEIYRLRSKDEVIERNYFISFIKTAEGWAPYDLSKNVEKDRKPSSKN